jgi:hypothetical protein
MIQIDRYTISARFLPAALVGAPLAFGAYTWAPFNLGLAKGAAATFVMAALAYMLSHATRNAGRVLEERLWPQWGGAPSITFLRHRDSAIDPVTKARYRQALLALQAVPSWPTPEEESADPAGADQVYAAASTWLRGRTRDRKIFPLVFEENVNYGYLRNLLACRTWGLAACALCLISGVTAFWLGYRPFMETLLTILVGLYLIFNITEGALRRQAGTYAKRLIEAIDILAQPGAKDVKSGKNKQAKNNSSAVASHD